MECAVMLSRDYLGEAAGRETPQDGEKPPKKKAAPSKGNGNKLPAARENLPITTH